MKSFRHDRSSLEYRTIKIAKGVIQMNEEYVIDGSAVVSIGKTRVVATAKFEIGQPFPDMPESAVISVNMENPVTSTKFAEPPDEKAIEVARIVDRGIRE
jgi:exosome complex component RRP42